MVYWNYRFTPALSHVWWDGSSLVYSGELLPLDISEDGIKIVLTFQ